MSTVKLGRGRGQKPVHMGNGSSQQTVWQGIRALAPQGEFTKRELDFWLFKHAYHNVNDGTVAQYLLRLTRGGYLSVRAKKIKGPVRCNYYTLIKNTGVEAPRLTRQGKPSKQAIVRLNLWRTMRVLGDFNCRELAAIASTKDTLIKESSARRYTYNLNRAGYLRLLEKANKRNDAPARYRLLSSRNTGPKSPIVQRDCSVFDANLNEVVWSPNAEEACKWN